MEERDFFDQRAEQENTYVDVSALRQGGRVPRSRGWCGIRRFLTPATPTSATPLAKAQSYMVRKDDVAACKNIRCRKRFDSGGPAVRSVPAIGLGQSTVILPRQQLQGQPSGGFAQPIHKQRRSFRIDRLCGGDRCVSPGAWAPSPVAPMPASPGNGGRKRISPAPRFIGSSSGIGAKPRPSIYLVEISSMRGSPPWVPWLDSLLQI